jgi:thioredoxin 1
MSDTIHTHGVEEFKKVVLESKIPVMVDFYAEWCGPCKLAAPVMEKLATEYKDKSVIVKLDVDAEGNRELAQQYGVMSIPTVFTFVGGKVVDQTTGFIGEPGYRSMLEKALQTA